ncbi:MAG TPA: HD domain-containing protein [Gemmatimonadaceae bacterium]|nr:HD domain-containing protein [Gemmatimonadaceae bacterium]
MNQAAQPGVVLPPWAQASPKRRQHIGRVVALLGHWAMQMRVSSDEASRWETAGLLHDALRDAPEPLLRALSGDATRPSEILHGPAAAVRAEQDGERRQDVLEAVRFHTVGCVSWARTGKALYLADFLEPGRNFLVAERAAVANQVPIDFDAAFRQGVRLRIEYSLSEGGALFPETVALWNAIR